MANLFQRRDLPKGDKQDDIGLKPERPFQILGITTEVSLGDLLLNVIFFSTLANQFNYSRLHVKYRNVRPYSSEIISLSPWIDRAEPLAEWPSILHRFMPKLEPKRYADVGRLNGGRAYYYDMVVTNQMARGTTLHALNNPVTLRIPRNKADDLQAQLVNCGIRLDRWFAVFHYRESNYAFRTSVNSDAIARDSPPEAFDALVDHIIELGGQAVRLGHPGLTPFRRREGFIDLSLIPNSFMLQAAAVSHARFMVAGPSGPIALAFAFSIPNTLVDAVDILGNWGADHSDVLTHEVTTPEGSILRNASLKEAGFLDSYRLDRIMKDATGYRVRKANADELKLVASKLFQRTMDCKHWRQSYEIPNGPKLNTLNWPLRPSPQMTWVDI